MPFRILTAAVLLFMLATPANCQNTDHQPNDAQKETDANNTGESPPDKTITKLKDTSTSTEAVPYREKQYCNGYSSGNGDSVVLKEFYRKWSKSHVF